jgi:flagellar basal body-associated protein FliL
MTTEPQTAPVDAPGKKGRSKMPFIVVAALMAVEGLAIFAATKFFIGGSPVPARGTVDEPLFDDKQRAVDAQPTAEVEITECRPNNTMTGKLLTFKLRVSALVSRPQQEQVAALIASNAARITDRINYVVRSAEPHHLNEPGLETIKRRFKHEIDGILGDAELIKEILIPEMLQSGPGL